MNWLDLDHVDVDEIVVEKTHGKEEEDSLVQHEWHEGLVEVLKEQVIPEFCELKADNCTLYNSYIFDCQCLHEFEQVSEKCMGTKCDLVRHFLEHGPRAVANVLKAESFRDAVEVVHQELKLIFVNHDFCKCGREIFKAFFKCAKFYNGNIMRVNLDCYDLPAFQTSLRNYDLESMSMLADKLLVGMCEKSRKNKSNICLDNIFEALKEVADMVEGTINEYNAYEEGTTREKRILEEKCDRLFGPLRAWNDAKVENIELEYDYFMHSEEGWAQLFNKTQAFMENLYCKWPCKKDRGTLYPCCFKRLLSDESIYPLIEKVILSIVRLPSTDEHEWEGFGRMRLTLAENVKRAMSYTIPEEIKDSFRRTVQAAKFCSGRTLRCSN